MHFYSSFDVLGYDHLASSVWGILALSSCHVLLVLSLLDLALLSYFYRWVMLSVVVFAFMFFLRTCEHANMWTCEHANMRTCEHVNMRTCEHVNMRTFEHANMPTCEHVNILVILIFFSLLPVGHACCCFLCVLFLFFAFCSLMLCLGVQPKTRKDLCVVRTVLGSEMSPLKGKGEGSNLNDVAFNRFSFIFKRFRF